MQWCPIRIKLCRKLLAPPIVCQMFDGCIRFNSSCDADWSHRPFSALTSMDFPQRKENIDFSFLLLLPTHCTSNFRDTKRDSSFFPSTFDCMSCNEKLSLFCVQNVSLRIFCFAPETVASSTRIIFRRKSSLVRVLLCYVIFFYLPTNIFLACVP